MNGKNKNGTYFYLNKSASITENEAFFFFFFPSDLSALCTAREAELRQLRKTNMEYEERNAALQKHVESMRSAVERLEGDVVQERTRNGLLQQHLDQLRSALTHSFASVPLPGETHETHRTRLTHTHRVQDGVHFTYGAREERLQL